MAIVRHPFAVFYLSQGRILPGFEVRKAKHVGTFIKWTRCAIGILDKNPEWEFTPFPDAVRKSADRAWVVDRVLIGKLREFSVIEFPDSKLSPSGLIWGGSFGLGYHRFLGFNSVMSKDNAERYPLLRTALRAIGLSGEKIDQVIQFIVEILDEREASGPDLAAFRLRDDFLSPAENSFFLVLRHVLASDGEILAKIRLGDLFYPSRGEYGERVGLRNRVDRKHVDFLVCHPTSFEPWFGVELDDSSHQRSDRKERDVLVDEVFAAANLPLVRIPVRSSYTPADLERRIRESTDFRVGTTSVPVPTKPPTMPNPAGLPNAIAAAGIIDVGISASASSPACPKCGESMLLRTARSGANAGNNFWGCRNYPRCRSMLPAVK